MMPDDELTVMWRQAKDQREQVKILAELNGVSTAVMAEKLTALGCQLPELPASWLQEVPPLKAKDPIFDMDRARALFAEGALRAAGWLVGKPAGLYAMRDLIGG